MSRTLLIIKPDATERNLIGHIIGRLEKARFTIVEMRVMR
jgi:nucleoside diphosphate kinase